MSPLRTLPAALSLRAVCLAAATLAAAAQDPLPRAPESGRVRETALDQTARRVDAEVDGWDTEVQNGLAEERLAILGALIEAGGADPEGTLAGVAGEDFGGARLRPDSLEPVFESNGVRVLRAVPGAEAAGDLAPGPEGLRTALAALAAPLVGGEHVSVKFKSYAIDLETDGKSFTTQVIYLGYGDPESGFVQQNATWTCGWRSDETGAPRLTSLAVSDYEEIIGPAGGQPLFADCTGSVLSGNEAYAAQVLPHLETWLASMQATTWAGFEGHQGLAVGDVDGDGLDDVYVCQPGGLPNLLFVQQADGSAREEGAARGVDFLDLAFGALLCDLDEDGDQDLVATAFPHLVLLANDGTGVFSEKQSVVLPNVYSVSAADYDLDGDLDLYTCAYKIPDGSASAIPVPYHDANNGLPNTLLRNDGGWKFVDATAESGLGENNLRFSFSASWEDYDDDGDPDLYVANDFGRNNLYRNEGGRFTDVAAEAGVEDISAGMGVTWGDYDGDGRMDLYVSNMFSSAGGRITYQRRFQEGAEADVIGSMRRHARGNSLFRNVGDGTFQDVSEEAGVTMGRWAWGSRFLDIDNDGWEDLFVPNGFATSEQADDL